MFTRMRGNGLATISPTVDWKHDVHRSGVSPSSDSSQTNCEIFKAYRDISGPSGTVESFGCTTSHIDHSGLTSLARTNLVASNAA